MPVWNPTCKLYVNGVERTSVTLANIQITYGKQDYSEEFRVGFASIEFVNANNATFIAVGDEVVIQMQDSTLAYDTIFTGVVTDFEITIESKTWLRTRIRLMSPLAHLGRKLVGFSNYPSQSTSARISAILADAGQVSWAMQPGKWNAQVGNWNQYENLSGTIASGTRTVGSYTGTSTGANALDLLKTAERSELGWLYETTNGKLNFAAYNTRYNYWLANFWTTFQATEVLLDSTSMTFTTGFTATNVQSFDNNGTGKLGTTIGANDVYYSTENTWITSSGIDNWIYAYLTRNNQVNPMLSAITIPLSALTSANRDKMINMFNGLPVRLQGLPAGFIVTGGTEYRGFVEGWSWNIQQGQAFISLNLSDEDYSYAGTLTPTNFSIKNL